MRLLIPLVICLLLTQCDGWRKKEFRKYILENGTEHYLKMDSYQNGRFYNTVEKAGKGVFFERMLDDGVGDHISAFAALASDSVVVIFDNKKKQVYTSNTVKAKPASRNILVDSAYTIENKELYRFTFTEEDYRLAEDL
jgi:hypothetical protein